MCLTEYPACHEMSYLVSILWHVWQNILRDTRCI